MTEKYTETGYWEDGYAEGDASPRIVTGLTSDNNPSHEYASAQTDDYEFVSSVATHNFTSEAG